MWSTVCVVFKDNRMAVILIERAFKETDKIFR